MALDIAAKIADLDEWGPGKTRSRYDYDTSEHLFAEIRQMGPEYFGRYCWARLRPGDVIYLTDAAGKRFTLITNIVDPSAHKVWYDVEREHDEDSILGEDEPYTIRWRGARGGRWCVIGPDNKVESRDHLTREAAQRVLLNLKDAA